MEGNAELVMFESVGGLVQDAVEVQPVAVDVALAIAAPTQEAFWLPTFETVQPPFADTVELAMAVGVVRALKPDIAALAVR